MRIRQELKKRQRPFLVPGNRWTERPTMSMIFDILSSVLVVKNGNALTTRRRLPSNLDPRLYELLEPAGLDHKACTTSTMQCDHQRETEGFRRKGLENQARDLPLGSIKRVWVTWCTPIV